jgi:hypothetical protein
MTTQIALLLFGAFLLLIAIIGGGFEMRELKIPKVGNVPRILAGVGGVLFVMFAIGVGAAAQPNSTKENSPIPATAEQPRDPSPTPVKFVVADTLDSDQNVRGLSDDTIIKIDGSPVGTLSVSERIPKGELVVTVAKAGQHSFAIDSTVVFVYNNRRLSVNCFGTGMIDVNAGSHYIVNGHLDPRGTCTSWLEKE